MDTALIQRLQSSYDEQEMLGWAQALIAAASPNPPGDERAAAREAQSILAGLGFSVEVHARHPHRPNLIARWGQGEPNLLWAGHLDVVPAEAGEWTTPPFQPVIKDGRLYGRGATDMKGPVAAFLEAVAMIQRSGLQPAGALTVVLAADEESQGHEGMEFLVREGLLKARFAVVGEPTSLRVCTCERGALWARFETEGKAAHGSQPHLGINAIEHMARIVQALRQLPLQGHHPLLGPPTLNIGVIAGGSKVNVVPDRCTLQVDRRTLPGETDAAILAEWRDLIGRLQAGDPTLKARVDLESFSAASEIDPDLPLCRLALEVTRTVTGQEAGPAGMLGLTDARFLVQEAGIPAIIWGPGHLQQAHTRDEFVEIADLRRGALAYALWLVKAWNA